MKYVDNIGNELNVGDAVLILVPKTDRTYRQGVVKDFRNPWKEDGHFNCDVLIEYNDGRLYCNKYTWDQRMNDPEISFTTKLTKSWRSNSDIIKLKPEYIL